MANRKINKKTPKTKSKNAIWMSFDLGIQGDYEGLYSWLDSHEARDCGDNLAFLNYEHGNDILEDLKADLDQFVKLEKRSKIYVIYLDPETKKMKGKFIFGNRKSPIWTGYGPQGANEEDHA
jgi:hypothetical protein